MPDIRCPFCLVADDKIVDKRDISKDTVIHRRRECLACGQRYSTYERVAPVQHNPYSRQVTLYRDPSEGQVTMYSEASSVFEALRVGGSSDAWREDAACRDADTALFYPDDTGRESKERTRQAKKICGGCPVKVECDAAGKYELWGTWGGRSQRERLLSKRQEYRELKAWSAALQLVYDGFNTDTDGIDDETSSSDRQHG